jgi:hypothetical protein
MKTIVIIAAISLVGCPTLPPPSGCRPDETRCENGAPQLCSPSTRWVASDRKCSDIGATCCLTTSAFSSNEFYACARPWDCVGADGGTP